MSGFLELSFELGALDSDAVEDCCVAAGATAVTFVDGRDDPVLEPLPGEFRLWPRTRVRALFGAAAEPVLLTQVLAARLGIAPESIRSERIADRAWEREWLRDFHAMRFGRRLWVCPHHEMPDAPGAIVVRLDPGLAFGTGSHPTTALCLQWLDARIAPGVSVIDYGCGSGILAIAAVKLGAREASCFDIDPQALLAAGDNAAANDVGTRVRICDSADSLPHDADLLLANILAGPLCELAPQFASRVRPGGTVVLAGLLEAQAPEVTFAYRACFDMQPFGTREGWVGLSGRRL
jgi:ribosomal protein L11 methyltransferase